MYRLNIEIDASSPTAALNTLSDIMYFASDVAYNFSSKGQMNEDDIPLVVVYQGEDFKIHDDEFEEPPKLSKFSLFKSNDCIDIFRYKVPFFKVGETVMEASSGFTYTVVANAYYNLHNSYDYLLKFDDIDSTERIIIPGEQLISMHMFNNMPEILQLITGKQWHWQENYKMFCQTNNASRKMRPSDVLNSYQSYLNKEEVPF